MNCRNCNFELSGGEDYCPRCGVPLKFNDEPDDTTDVPAKELPDIKSGAKNTIFDSEPVYIYSGDEETPKKHEKKSRKSSGAAVAFITIFMLCVFGVGAFVAAEYLGIVPAVSFDFKDRTTENQSLLITQYPVSYNDSDGIVSPDISYKPSLCFVCTQTGLSLRKGPDDSYAQTDLLPHGLQVQIIGGSLTRKDRVYVYVPGSDSYGWLCSSFLTSNQTLFFEADIQTTHEESLTTSYYDETTQ